MTPAPYPADARAKGWRFELDYERIDQSDTWSLAAEVPMAQPALLMMWLVAWTQEPCGSLPSDENLIRAKCHIPPKQWASLRDVLMRGWWAADDGRLYHDTITKRVLEMLEYRKKTAERVAKFKAAHREQQDGNALPTCESQVKNDTGTGTGTIEEKEIPPTVVVGRIAPAAYRVPDCPHERIVEAYHEALPRLPRVVVLNNARRAAIRGRWAEVCAAEKFDGAAGFGWFQAFFRGLAFSPFLAGANERQWKADLEWLMKPNNFAKAIEGRYHREKA